MSFPCLTDEAKGSFGETFHSKTVVRTGVLGIIMKFLPSTQLETLTFSLCVLLTACSLRVVEVFVQLVLGFVINCPTSWPRLLWNRSHGTQRPPPSDEEYVSHCTRPAILPWTVAASRSESASGRAKLLSIALFLFFKYASFSWSGSRQGQAVPGPTANVARTRENGQRSQPHTTRSTCLGQRRAVVHLLPWQNKMAANLWRFSMIPHFRH